jgi:ubiquinone/menaquinone biosynthesis C-methylase UbiE
MLLARLVGSSGEVVAIERDARSINRARSRASQRGLRNVTFVQSDITQFSSDASFDAVVGRFVLQFLPDPVAALRFLSQRVRPGGVIAFQEGSWAPSLALSRHLPLWSAAVFLLHEVSGRFGVNMEMGPALHKAFQDAGLPAPSMRLQMELGHEPDFTRWVSDAIHSVRPQIQKLNFSIKALGDLDTLQERLQSEVASSNTVVPWLAMVGAHCRKPTHQLQ